jgi:transposase
MVWAGFGAFGQLELQWGSKHMNSIEYQTILHASLLPYLAQHKQKKLVFQQDNAPIHRSASTKNWFTAKKINVMEWPVLSPDLNPMENVWGHMVRRMYANNKQYTSIAELKTSILATWNGLGQDLLNNHIRSMKKRIIELIKRDGGPTSY